MELSRSDYITVACTFFSVVIADLVVGHWGAVGCLIVGAIIFVKGLLTKAPRQAPQIQGEVFGVNPGNYGSGHTLWRKHAWVELSFQVRMCNQQGPATTLETIELDGSDLEPGVAFEPVQVPPSLVLSPGIAQTIEVATTANTYAKYAEEVAPISLDRMRVTVVDSFGNRHLIAVRRAQTLTFGRYIPVEDRLPQEEDDPEILL